MKSYRNKRILKESLDNFEAALTNIVEELPDTKYSTMASGILKAIDNGFIPNMPTETLIDRLKHYGYNDYGEELEYAYDHLSESRQSRTSRRFREAVVPFEELNSYTKQTIEEIAEDDYYMNHKSSVNDVIDEIYGDDEISPKLARAVADYYDEVYDSCEADDLDAQWNDEDLSYGCDD